MMFAGGVAIVGGALWPWVQFPVLGVVLRVPGVAFAGGAAAAAVGAIILSGAARRWPAIGAACGLAALAIGTFLGPTAVRSVYGRILDVDQGLAPLNGRLAQVNLPTIEPFGDAFGLRSQIAGAGAEVVAIGGAAAAAGGGVAVVFDLLARTCGGCGLRWPARRHVTFCPRCGEAADPSRRRCPRCARFLRRGDRYCVDCGCAAAELAA
jgi:hypothetical protein